MSRSKVSQIRQQVLQLEKQFGKNTVRIDRLQREQLRIKEILSKAYAVIEDNSKETPLS